MPRLRRWERERFLIAEFRTKGGHRRYSVRAIEEKFEVSKPLRTFHAIAYARVSSHEQKEDLFRQSEKLKKYCQVNFPSYDCIEDLGSGLNYKKPGLKKLLRLIFARRVTHLVLNHKDRLLRFGSELVFDLCKHFCVEVVILEDVQNSSFEEELTRDVLELMTVFSARFYGRRSHKNRIKAAS
ncbi:MAG: IS607 family transposase [Proteobacteria bacterium]|nr:MAG: IS607 family transposase [Pseudomonadota bacterium]